MLLGLGLSCWFWLAALASKGSVRIEEMVQGKFDFHNNFTPLGEMFDYDGLFAVGWIISAVLLISAAALVQEKKSFVGRFACCGFVFGIFANRYEYSGLGKCSAAAFISIFLAHAGPSFIGCGTNEWRIVL